MELFEVLNFLNFLLHFIIRYESVFHYKVGKGMKGFIV